MQWTIEMNDIYVNHTKPCNQELLFYEDYVAQPGQGTIYYLSGDITSEIILLDKDGNPFNKPEKRIGFV